MEDSLVLQVERIKYSEQETRLISIMSKPINVVVAVLLKKKLGKFFLIQKIDVQKLRPKSVGSKKNWVKQNRPKNLCPKKYCPKNLG